MAIEVKCDICGKKCNNYGFYTLTSSVESISDYGNAIEKSCYSLYDDAPLYPSYHLCFSCAKEIGDYISKTFQEHLMADEYDSRK